MGKISLCKIERRPKMHWVILGFILCTLVTISESAPKPKGLEIEQKGLVPNLYPACFPQYYKSRICRACCDTQYQIYGQLCPYSHPKSYCYNCCFFLFQINIKIFEKQCFMNNTIVIDAKSILKLAKTSM